MPIPSFPTATAAVAATIDRPMKRQFAATFGATFATTFATKSLSKPVVPGLAARPSRSAATRHYVRHCARGGSAAQKSAYDRARDLPGLLPLWPAEIADASTAAQQRIVARLRSALRDERKRGLAGHWAYNLSRHAALFRAYSHELARLEAATA